jgi:hypothetical protein
MGEAATQRKVLIPVSLFPRVPASFIQTMKPLLADTLMYLHFLWAAFMVFGLPIGLMTRSRILRWVHFIGMLLTALVALVGVYCPLTILEEALRWDGNAGTAYGGNFLARHLSNLLYPEVKPWFIRAATIIWGVLTVLLMVLIPPGRRLKRNSNS